jgi:hypothetical protein
MASANRVPRKPGGQYGNQNAKGKKGSGATISVNQLNLHIDRLAAIQLHFKLPA